jgi:hypothetical protein
MLLPPTRNDALDPNEIVFLARAIDAQCKSSPTFRKYVEVALSASSGGQLVMALGFIGARRMARHGVLPEGFDKMLGTQIAQMVTGNPEADAPPIPEPIFNALSETESEPESDAVSGT